MKKKIMINDKFILGVISYILLSFFALICLLPFVLVISGSLSSETSVMRTGYSLFPKEFTFSAYTFAFEDAAGIFSAYKMSIIVTVIGTVLSVFFSSMAAYVLARKDFKYRNKLSFYYFFTTIFSGGLVPWYILCVRYLQFKEMPYVALITPLLFNYFYIVVMRSNITASIPDSLIESAKLDGAGSFLIYIKIVLPLSKSIIATIVLFTAMGYWNDYYHPMLFVDMENYITLQYYLYRIISTMRALNTQMSSVGVNITYPAETFKMAITVLSVGPIFLVYPFVQKYLVKGLMVGAVKG